jgi:hypothetical protein
VFPVLAGFLAVLLTLQRDVGWLQRQSWRRVNIERRLAESIFDRHVLLLLLYIIVIVTIVIERSLVEQATIFAKIVRYVHLVAGTAALYLTLFLPFEIKKMRMLPYDDMIGDKREPRDEGR